MSVVVDYSKQIYDSLPENARQYYVSRTERNFSEWTHQLSVAAKVWNTANLLRIYPVTNIRYLNSNELLCVVVNGEHRIYQGPGFRWVVGIADSIVQKVQIGNDIDFGPIKVVYVAPGTLKFAKMRNLGRPMLLGPGMHYFNDLNLEVSRTAINMNFTGDNHVLRIDDNGAFQFVFVKTGTEAIIINRDGVLSTFGPGLHFLQAPDALKCFVSVQQEHLNFGSHLNNQYFLTADNVELFISATLFYRIVDVKTMFTTRIKDERDLIETLTAQAMATLLTIIRSESFSTLGRREMEQTVKSSLKDNFGDNAAAVPGMNTSTPIATAVPVQSSSAPPINDSQQGKVLESITSGFQNIIKDAEPEFQRIMELNFGTCGIEIQSLRIERIEFADKNMQKQVSEFAMINTKLNAQQQSVQAQRAIQVAEAERDAASLLIKTKAETDKKIMMMEAENRILIESARAEAQNKLIKADAESQAKIKIGEAEIVIMEKQNRMPNAALRIVAEAQKEVLKGVQKVVYTDQQSLLLKPYMAIPDLANSLQMNDAMMNR